MTDLLDVVDVLTKPKIEHVAQRSDRGEWLRTHTVVLPPLLVRMHEAVWPSGELNGTGTSSPGTRSPVDVSALYEYAQMCVAIGSWCLILRVKPTRDPVRDLRAWYAATMKLNGFDPAGFYLRETRRWQTIIETYLDPPKAFEAKVACPVCKATGWGDQWSGGSSWPIEVRYRLTEDLRTTDEAATCRACRTVWKGHESISELVDELGEKEGNA